MLIKNYVKTLIQSSLRYVNLALVNSDTLLKLEGSASAVSDLDILSSFPEDQASKLLKCLKRSKAQYRQDLFALSSANFKYGGFFVEFGATNGVNWSNTFLLEKNYGWKGILAEPAKTWHNSLRLNRECSIETECVWKKTGELLNFREVDFSAELSTISSFNPEDKWHKERTKGDSYEVRTISLNDLLDKHNAPSHIDFLSIDTEGSELEILSSFDFSKHNIHAITCEHNFTADRERIFHLLSKNGYVRKYEGLSGCDDWYVRMR